MATNESGLRRAVGPRPNAPLWGFVLQSYDWSETSLIVELFTRERGRVVVAAKGAKRPTSNFRPVLLPFQPLMLLLGKTPADEQAEVLNLRSAEWAGGQPIMPAASLMAGYYLNELLLKLLARQDPHAGLFDAYADTVMALAQGVDEGTALRAFELLMLRELGVLPDLSTATLSAQALLPEAGYTLQAEAGLVSAAGGLTGHRWVGLEAALAHGGAPAVRHACAGVAAALRVPLRELLHYHLGHTTLRTRQVWQGVRKLTHSARAPAVKST
jgi:DNA repair protein RecO (recombination protein O)